MVIYVYILFSFIFSSENIDISTDRTNIVAGESFNLIVSISDVEKIPQINLPKFSDFNIISGPSQSQSTNIQIVNGKMKKEINTTIEWTLMPNKIGKLIIPEFIIVLGSEKYTSRPMLINVTKQTSQSNTNILQYFIEATVDNKNPYRGEQVTLTYTLYTKIDITSYNEELPKFRGFWTEEIFSPKQLSLRQVKKNNSIYSSAITKKIALFPTKSGAIIIDPISIVIGVRESQQRWNSFSLFGPPSKKVNISSNQITLDVSPLPINKNGEMSAVVGNWNIKSKVSTNNIKQDEAFTFNILIKGTGNIQSIDLAEVPFPNELEVFEPEVEKNENPLRDILGGEKSFKWVLIPRISGEIYLPKIKFTYFNPKTREWVSKYSEKHKISVSPNTKNLGTSIGLSKEEVALVSKDIRFLDEAKPKWRKRNIGLVSYSTILLVCLSLTIYLMPFMISLIYGINNKSISERRAKRAIIIANKILSQKLNNSEMIYKNINKAIITFINNKTNIERQEYSKKEILDILKKHNAGNLVEKIERIIINGEIVRYASIPPQDVAEDLNEIKILLKEIEDVWT